jgi:hypothetical protein
MANTSYRPYQSEEVKKKVDTLLNKLGVSNVNRTHLNNLLVGVGVTCIDKTLDAMLDEMKKKNFKADFMKFLQ